MSRPRKTTGGPLATMTPDEIAAMATACGVTLTTADAWRHRRPARPLAYRIADALHARDTERWPEPVALARRIREDGPRR
jgi:hypothetical protein